MKCGVDRAILPYRIHGFGTQGDDMNPFHLSGPVFLLFYAVLSVLTLLGLRFVRSKWERTDPSGPPPVLTDPYQIAMLRGGKHELIRVAVVSLVDRGLLLAEGDTLSLTSLARTAQVRPGIERAVLEYCDDSVRTTSEMMKSSHFDREAESCERELRRLRLLPDESIRSARYLMFWSATAVLLFFAFTKIYLTLADGQSEVEVLLFMSFMVIFMAGMWTFTRRTWQGDAYVSELQNLCGALRLRAGQIRPGSATSELAMLTAVFGVAALPDSRFQWARDLFPRAAAGNAVVGDAGGGAACGSCAGGGGAGGGGCAGGCGAA